MPGLATALTIMLDALVVDRTDLKGYYDFDVDWRNPDVRGKQPNPLGFSTEGSGFLLSNLQGELGLRLVKKTGAAEYWVIDRVELPTDN
jgi:uncharacterized protein (TIGR03435 family)